MWIQPPVPLPITQTLGGEHFPYAPTYCTYTNIKDGDQTMINIYACAKSLHCCIRICRVAIDGIKIDHAAVHLDLTLPLLKWTDLTAL